MISPEAYEKLIQDMEEIIELCPKTWQEVREGH
jgi:hypothetical protein